MSQLKVIGYTNLRTWYGRGSVILMARTNQMYQSALCREEKRSRMSLAAEMQVFGWGAGYIMATHLHLVFYYHACYRTVSN